MNAEGITPVQREAIIALLGPVSPSVIYLFGSVATGREHPDSDIDIAVLPDAGLDPVACFELANKISDRLGRQVDLIDLSHASSVMAKEVLRTGVAIHVADLPAKQEFEMRALSDYARLNEERHATLSP